MGNPQNSISRKIVKLDDKKEDLTTVTTVRIGGIAMNFYGKAGGISQEVENVNNTSSVIAAAGGIFGTMIINVIALAFMWIAFMAAKNVSKTVSKVVSPFEEIGKSIGGLSKSIPKMIPLPSKLGGSVGGLQTGLQRLSTVPQTIANQKYDSSGMGKFISSLTGQSSEMTRTLSRMREFIKDGGNDPERLKDIIREIQDGQKNGHTYNMHTHSVKDSEAMIKQFNETIYKSAGIDQQSIQFIRRLKDKLDNGGKLSVDENAQFLAAL